VLFLVESASDLLGKLEINYTEPLLRQINVVLDVLDRQENSTQQHQVE